MLPTRALRPYFSNAVRYRGDGYASEGLVEIIESSPEHVRALVTGTAVYTVTIRRTQEPPRTVFAAGCTCAFFAGNRVPCKHIWATLRTAERIGALSSPADSVLDRRQVELIVADSERTQAVTPMGAPAVALSPAGVFLARVQQRLADRDHPLRHTFAYADATLMYVIDAAGSASPMTRLLVMYQRRNRGGRIGVPKVAHIAVEDVAAAPPLDRRLLALLMGAARDDAGGSSSPSARRYERWEPEANAPAAIFSLPAPLAAEVLPLIARHARAWIKPSAHADVVPLAWDGGPPWRFELTIDETTAGFRLDGALVRGDGSRIAMTEPHTILSDALVAARGTLAVYESSAADVFRTQLATSGTIEIARSEKPALAMLVARSGAPLDTVPDTLRLLDVRVVPTPRLSVAQAGAHPRALPAHLVFDYDGTVVEGTNEAPVVFDVEGQRRVHRDLTAEANMALRLDALGARPAVHGGERTLDLPARDFADIVGTLIAEGWQVEAEGHRYRSASGVRLNVSSGIDWFDLDGQVIFGDERVPLTAVLAALAAKQKTIRLGDGTVGLLPEDWLARFAPLAAAGDVQESRVRFTPQQAAVLDALLAGRAEDAVIDVDETFARIRQELASFQRVEPAEEPESFQGTLRPYQRDALGWFAFLRRFGFGGCLADDMGLGKTIVVLALLEERRRRAQVETDTARPSLIVVPRSLVGNWMAEGARFTPELRVLDYSHGARSSDAAEAIGRHDVALVTYGTLRRDAALLASIEFDYLILDEAQAIKNAATASAKAARLLRGRHRLALSGTPVENHLGELWSLFEFLNPGVLGRASVFERATTMLSAGTDPEMAAAIARGLRPFVLRRTKQQVARELPARTEQTITCELSPKERTLYESLRRHYRLSLLHRIEREGLGKSKMHILEALLRLRQASCHPGLIEASRRDESSAKFDVLIPRLEEVRAEGHKALVFSQFTSLLALLRTRLDAAGLTYEYLDGKTRDRAERVERFQTSPEIGVFLVSLKAGGLGLNLTAAEYVFLLDPWWNPAAEAQAIDRAHRIGQTREVFAYRLIAQNTIEEKVLLLQQSKRSLADAVLTADAVGLRQLAREDLELLLS